MSAVRKIGAHAMNVNLVTNLFFFKHILHIEKNKNKSQRFFFLYR